MEGLKHFNHQESVLQFSLCELFRFINYLISYCKLAVVFAQTSVFTYQGRLTDSGTPANRNYDLQFTLWDALMGGTQQPQPSPVTVARSAGGRVLPPVSKRSAPVVGVVAS